MCVATPQPDMVAALVQHRDGRWTAHLTRKGKEVGTSGRVASKGEAECEAEGLLIDEMKGTDIGKLALYLRSQGAPHTACTYATELDGVRRRSRRTKRRPRRRRARR